MNKLTAGFTQKENVAENIDHLLKKVSLSISRGERRRASFFSLQCNYVLILVCHKIEIFSSEINLVFSLILKKIRSNFKLLKYELSITRSVREFAYHSIVRLAGLIISINVNCLGYYNLSNLDYHNP